MFDGVKLRINGEDRQRLRSHYLLHWKPNGKDRLGRDRFKANWEGFIFKGDATGCTFMRGSLHKAHHGGENWQDFTRSQFVEVVQHVCITLGLHPANLRLANLEVGANIVPPIPTAEVLRAIVLHRTQSPTRMPKGEGIKILHTAYRFKIYNKARQYQRVGELLRAEVAINKMRTLAKWKVRTLADLLEPGTWDTLRGYLLARFKELLIAELGPPPEGLHPTQAALWTNASNPAYWAGLTKQRRSEQRRTLQALYDRHVPHPLKATLYAAIAAKLEELNDGPAPDLFTNGATVDTSSAPRTFSPTGTESDQSEQTISSTATDDPNRTFAPHVIKGAKVRGEGLVKEVRECPVCGRDITHQDTRSRVCSERIYGKEGKKCRNAMSNRTHSLRRMAGGSGLLFDQRPFIVPYPATNSPT